MMLHLIVSLFLLGAICEAQDSRTVLQYLQDENYNKLVELIYGAGLSDELSSTSSVPITLFAPSDAAFDALPPDVLADIQTNTSVLRSVLQGHIVEETILGFFIRDGVSKTSQAGTSLTFNAYQNNQVKTVNGVSLGADVILSNGVVHKVDQVLMPVTSSISTIVAESDPEFRDLFGFLVLGGLFGTLSTGGPYTVFAPTDAAFALIDVSSFVANRTQVKEVLLDHVVDGQYWSAGLTDGMTLTTLGGKQLTINLGQNVQINNSTVLAADVGATNGVIHIVNSVIG